MFSCAKKGFTSYLVRRTPTEEIIEVPDSVVSGVDIGGGCLRICLHFSIHICVKISFFVFTDHSNK